MIENNNGTQSSYRIRKLTPIETWRLMGFTDEDFLAAKVGDRETAKELIDKYEPTEHLKMMQEVDKISKVSNTQLYKQAGNSIVVDVLYYIFKELYEAMPYLFDDLKVSSYFSGIGAFESGLDRLYADINSGSVVAPACMSSESAGGRECIIYDDYNSNVRADQNTIGTLTTSIGNGLRSAYKLIEH